MKQFVLSPFARFLFVIFVLLGILAIVLSQLSFEVLGEALDGISPDGRFESFTLSRFYVLRTFLFTLGAFLILCFAWILVFPESFISIFRIGQWWIGKYLRVLKSDALLMWTDSLPNLKGQKENLVIFLLILMAMVIRTANMFIPMDHDEAYNYNAFASYPIWHVISDYHLPNNHVLLTIAVNVSTRVFGNHLWAIRIPTFIAGICMIPAGYWLAKRLYDKETAVLSGVFITFFPVLVKYSVLARGYAIISLLTLLLLLIGDYVRIHRNHFAWLMMVILSALGFYTIPIMLLPFGALYIWLFLSWLLSNVAFYHSTLDFFKFCLISVFFTALLTAVLYAPILLNPSNRLFGNQFIAPVGWDEYPSVILFRLKNTWVDWVNTVPDWLIILGVSGVILSIILHSRISGHKVPLQIAFVTWLCVFVIYRRPDMETRMWTYLAAPLLIWSAGGLVGSLKILLSSFLKEWQVNKVLSSAVLTVSLIFTASILPTIPVRWQVRGSVENTVIFLKDRLRNGDLVWMSPVFVPQTRYYFDLYDIPLSYLRQPAKFKRVFVLVRSVNGSAAAGDTLVVAAPRNEQGLPAIDLETARILLQYEDLALYECYPSP